MKPTKGLHLCFTIHKQMEKSEILLLVNSVLLAIISIMFLVIGYFLKDLHKDFKILIERVNKLYSVAVRFKYQTNMVYFRIAVCSKKY